MNKSAIIYALSSPCFAFIVLIGAGCMNGDLTYVKSPETANIVVLPNVEGAGASTGGAEATVTPLLATELIVKAFPVLQGATASEPVEQKQPVPLPDGTRSEYVTVSREYTVESTDGVRKVYNAVITDTRGIPALLAFIQSYSAYETEQGFRRNTISEPDQSVWLTYTYGPNKETDGTGNLLMNFRNRFLIQIEGGEGVGSSDLSAFAATFNLDALR